MGAHVAVFVALLMLLGGALGHNGRVMKKVTVELPAPGVDHPLITFLVASNELIIQDVHGKDLEVQATESAVEELKRQYKVSATKVRLI